MRLAAAVGAMVVVAAVVVVVVVTSVGGGGGGYRVEALFDNAGFAVPGEQVRIAGAPVGTISALSVTRQNLAAVTLTISNRDFVPFYANATCRIRPQSLIAERYVDCTPGSSSRRPLRRIASGYGAGAYLLPVTQTSSPIDPDIVQNVSQDSVRQSLSVILDELGTGLAGRGSDLNAVILRADPALAQTERVFRLLASQNRVLAKLATDSNTVLAPLAQTRSSLADFVVQANRTATASAAERTQLAASIRLLPAFLRQLKPLMADLGQLAQQGTPVVKDAGSSAAALDAEFRTLVPFATRAKTAITDLGNAAQKSESSLVASQGLARQLQSVGTNAEPSGAALQKLLTSLDSTGGIEQLMSLLFYGSGATNGYNADGHYVRVAPVVGSCTAYARTPIAGCSADFSGTSTASASSSSAGSGKGSHTRSRTRASTRSSTSPGTRSSTHSRTRSSTSPGTRSSTRSRAGSSTTMTLSQVMRSIAHRAADDAVRRSGRAGRRSTLRGLLHYLTGSGS
jgi:ABC-type transporter Mla subunit MlaD